MRDKKQAGRKWVFAAAAGALALAATSAISGAAAFLPGDLVVSRVGDGSVGLTGNAAPVFVDEYLPATPTQASPVQSVGLPNAGAAPTSGNRNLLMSGAANSEGIITLSGNSGYVALAGYNTTAGTAGPNSTSALTINRVVGLIDVNGNVDTTTSLNDAMSSQNVRTAYTDDGSTVWVAGNGGNGVTINSVSTTTNGVHAAQRGKSDPTNLTPTSVGLNTSGLTSNFRALHGANGQLYVSSNSTSGTTAAVRGVDSVGVASGFPTAPPQVNTSLPTFPADGARSVADYWFASPTTLYLADTRAFTNSASSTSGGIQKYLEIDTNADTIPDTWQFQYTLGVGNNISNSGAGNAGAAGLTGTFDVSNNPVLYATTFDTGTGGNAASTNLVTITDTGAASTFTLLATSPTNTAFRGVTFAPTVLLPEPASLGLMAIAIGIGAARRRGRRD